MSGGLPAAQHRVIAGAFHCGPLELTVRAHTDELYEKIAETLSLYDITWTPPYRSVNITAIEADLSGHAARGEFLRCARMLVDRSPTGLRATTTSGAEAIAQLGSGGERWRINVSQGLIVAGKLEELEDVLSLILTTGWRREGWTPIHAAAVVKHGVCAVFCAPTGGGKTTLTAAFVRRGWRVLGDDKLLLRMRDGKPEIAALLHTFNLHPRTREWFPEVGDLECLPRYSVWTEKRKVSVGSIWSHAPAARACPSVLVSLQRHEATAGISALPMDQRETLATLLRQTVIPNDAATARGLVSSVARASTQLRGLHVDVPTDAYRDPAMLDRLEEMVLGTS